MAGRHHNAAVAGEGAHGIGERGCGHELGIEVHKHAVGSKYAGCSLGKQCGFDAAVVGDGYAGICKFFMKIVAIALSRPGHRVHIEQVGACANHAAQTARAKFEIPIKAILYGSLIAGNLL